MFLFISEPPKRPRVGYMWIKIDKHMKRSIHSKDMEIIDDVLRQLFSPSVFVMVFQDGSPLQSSQTIPPTSCDSPLHFVTQIGK